VPHLLQVHFTFFAWGGALLRIHILTLFPEMFQGPFDESIMKRAQKKGLLELSLCNIRDYACDSHRTTDDSPYGGGPGMVMKPEPLFEAVESIRMSQTAPVILLSPQGRQYTQSDAQRLAKEEEIILVCGHYEGVDERVCRNLITEELSVGDYVMTGGEIPAMAVVDSVVRLLPGVLGHGTDAISDDSFTSGLLQYPQYTRPADFRGWTIPDVLLSGNHAAIARWRRWWSLRRTEERRPDLLTSATLSNEDQHLLEVQDI
jgi:tRNA (guanine37-N1)-methyltransferase